MKTCSSYTVVGTYNEKNLMDLLEKIKKLGIRMGPGRDILKTMIDWPQNQYSRRSEIFPYPTNSPVQCTRVANFFELCAFILRYPAFVVRHGDLEAFDDSLEDLYKVTGIELTVPVFGLYNDHVTLYLKSRETPSVEFKLAAND